MYCIKCGEKLPDGAAYCASCGQKVNVSTKSDTKENSEKSKSQTSGPKILHLRCASCGGDMQVSDDEQEVTCPYCGAKEKILESDDVKTEKIKRDVEFAKMADRKERREQKEQKEERTEYKNGRLAKITIIFAVICLICMFSSFSSKHILAGLIAMIQTGLFIVSFLMGMQIVASKHQRMYLAVALLAFLLIIPYSRAASIQKYEKLSWPSSGMASMLPEPDVKYGEVKNNDKYGFNFELNKTTEEDYEEYVSECKDVGYTLEADESDISYHAYNKEGYKVDISRYTEKMSVYLDPPKELDDLTWPTMGLGAMVPAADSDVGTINFDNDSQCSISVGNTSKSDIPAYIQKVIDAGFTEDYEKGDTYYRGYNTNGYYVSISYSGNNVMGVMVEAPKSE